MTEQTGTKRARGRIIVLWLLFAAALALTVYLWPVIMPFFLALLFAYLLRPLLNRMLALGVPAALAIILLYIYVGIGCYLLVFFCMPIISEQFRRLLEYLPQFFEMLRGMWQQMAASMRRIELPEGMELAVATAFENIRDNLAARMEDTASRLALLLRTLLYLALMPILSFYMLRDKQTGAQKLVALISPRERPEMLRLLRDIDHLLRRFVGGYLLVSLVVAILSSAFYWAIGLDYALVLGLLMGVADLIPYFGPFLGAIPAVIVALGDGLPRALVCIAGLLVLQQVESAIITPKIMGDKIGLSPLLTIFAVMAGGYLFGILGTILALPLTAALLLLAKYVYARLVGVEAG